MALLRSALVAGALALIGAAPGFVQKVCAQETVALAIEGWQTSERGGVTYYRCASPICAAGSVVSTKPQPHRPALTFAEFEDHHRGLAKHYANTGNMRDVRITEPKERTIEGVRIFQVSREVEWTSNNRTFSIEARLIGKDRSYTLVSDSPKREWTANNFEGFLRQMVNIAGIQAPR